MCRATLCWTFLVVSFVALLAAEEKRQPLDPAAWGSDHVGKPLPEYVTGDECLFCHRGIGNHWAQNRHQKSMRRLGPESQPVKSLRQDPKLAHLAREVQFALGNEQTSYLLKRGKQYGKLSVLAHSRDMKGKTESKAIPAWDQTVFENRCAGCHTTAVEPQTRAFSAVSLDCYVCHGSVPLEHTRKAELAHLSQKNRKPREVVSTCGQCHLRGGKSRSSHRPYPNAFVAGDNLLRDFDVDLSLAAIGEKSSREQHIYLSVREVALFGNTQPDCLACHEIHTQSTARHRERSWSGLCKSCHTRIDGTVGLRPPQSVPNPACRIVREGHLKENSDGRD